MRDVKLTLSSVSGTINYFYAFVNGKKVISEDGTSKREWKGEISDGEVRIKVRVTGIGEAQYVLSIDLPGTAKDQKLTFSLEGGYHEFELNL